MSEKLKTAGCSNPRLLRALSVKSSKERQPSQEEHIEAVKNRELHINVAACDVEQPRAAIQSSGLWRGLRTSWRTWRQRLTQIQHGRSTRQSSLDELTPETSTHPIQENEAASSQQKRTLAVQRWQWAIRSVVNSRSMMRSVDLLHDHLAPADDRLYAFIRLEMHLAAIPQRKQLAIALLKRRENKYSNIQEHLMNELFITGEKIFEFFTPSGLGQHKPYFTVLFLLAILITYWFMAGQYPAYMMLSQPATVNCIQQHHGINFAPYGPLQFISWMFPRDSEWCFEGKAGSFNANFLILWGARWGPDMKEAPQRWISSIFLHQNFMHLFSNCLLFLALTFRMEKKYGTWRIVLLWVMSALGGNLFSAVFENGCIAVVGASGGIFGIFGLFIADFIMNFETIQRPFMQSVIVLVFFSYFVITIAITPTGTSHLSHVGGFVCGLFPAFLFVPNLHCERWEALLPVFGGIVILVVYISLPMYFYLSKYAAIIC